MTKADRLAAALTARGDVELERTRRYRVFRCKSRPECLFFVGKMGGLRYGTCITKSLSLTDGPVERAILSAWEKQRATDAVDSVLDVTKAVQ